MKKFNEWLNNLDSNEILWLAAIFLAAMLGTLLSGLVLKAGMESFGGEDVLVNLLISLVATIVYAAVVLAVFSVLFPETIPALKRILTRDQNNGRS
jgi:cellobiose-specific phosphotransferase system component IIC